MQMFIHWDERSRSMFTDTEYRYFLDCLNGLAAEFGRRWVEKLAGVRKTSDQVIIAAVGNDNVGDGGIGILRAIQLHEDWEAVKRCANADKLRAKLSKVYDNHHVDLEIHVAAAFARCGVVVELEPKLSSGKISDFRAQASDGSWLYVEVSKRVFEIPKLERDIGTLLDLSLGVAPGRACSLHILGKFSDRNFSRIEGWLAGLQGSQLSRASLMGLAEFRSFDHGYDMATQVLSSGTSPLQVKSKCDHSTSSFATIYYHVPDFGFAAKFAEEREQLPSDGTGLIVIDVTGIAGSLAAWHAEALEALGASENSHVLGVTLLAKGIDSASFPRWRFDASHAKNPTLEPMAAPALTLIGHAFPARSDADHCDV